MKPINQVQGLRFAKPQEKPLHPAEVESRPTTEDIDECPLIVCIGLKAYLNFTCLSDYEEADQQKLK
jgi:hypothetical protein